MKTAILVMCVMLLAPAVQSYEIARAKNGEWIQWDNGEITVTVDPSVTELRDDAAQIIETAFMTWLDYVDADITINFVTDVCDTNAKNCVIYIPSKNGVASTKRAWYPSSGTMAYSDVEFYSGAKPADLEHIALHEAGHFWGLTHSENPDAIMYYSVTGSTELHDDDINGIMTLYGDGTEYPSIEPEPIDYSFNGCSMHQVGRGGNIFNLIF